MSATINKGTYVQLGLVITLCLLAGGGLVKAVQMQATLDVMGRDIREMKDTLKAVVEDQNGLDKRVSFNTRDLVELKSRVQMLEQGQ